MKILVAVDGSPYTRRMLAYLAAHDEWLDGQHQYTVIHAVMPVPARVSQMLSKAQLKAYYDDAADKVFKPIRSFFSKQGLAAVYMAKVGPVAQTIATQATQGGAELLIMGSHGHSALGNLLMGSVATQLLAHCKTPVLLVR